MENGRFTNGFILGLVIGGGAVFLFGTKTGKKLLKKYSEQGFTGLTDILEEVNLEGYEEEEPLEEAEAADSGIGHTNGELKTENMPKEKKEAKKRFFKRPSKLK